MNLLKTQLKAQKTKLYRSSKDNQILFFLLDLKL